MYYSPAPQVAITTTNNKTHLPALNAGTFTVCFLAELRQHYVNPGCACFVFFFLFARWQPPGARRRGAGRSSAMNERGRCRCRERDWVNKRLSDRRDNAGHRAPAANPTRSGLQAAPGDVQRPSTPGFQLRHFDFSPATAKYTLHSWLTASWGGGCSHQRGTLGLSQHKCFLPLLLIVSWHY